MRRIWSMEVLAGARAEMSKNSAGASNDPVTQKGAPDLGTPEKMLKRSASFLGAGKLVGERDVAPECLVRSDEIAAGSGAGVDQG